MKRDKNGKNREGVGAISSCTDTPASPSIKAGYASEIFPIVAIGTSAGGLEALKAIFSHLPETRGAAFVVLQHAGPKGELTLSRIIQSYTSLPVIAIEDGMVARPGCIYVSPADKLVDLIGGRFLVRDLPSGDEGKLPIDRFFSSLAEEQGHMAAGIILSGAGADGAAGIWAIKRAGGMVMVQDPQQAAFQGMPWNAIHTGLVDAVLPAEEIPGELLQYLEYYLGIPQEKPDERVPPGLSTIINLVRFKTGFPAQSYQETFMSRMVHRRMAAHRITDMATYYDYLKESPEELAKLVQDLLVRTTGFFRKSECFHFLRQRIVPEIIGRKGPRERVRLWVPGCSSGEEAYTLAILFHEVMRELGRYPQLEIFATDIDAEAISLAREARYPAGIEADVPEEYRKRYFTRNGNFYVVKCHLRRVIFFSVQNLLRDFAISRVDLISCRNVLIYLKPAWQRKILSLFHKALVEGGYLFLGSTETIGDMISRFRPVDFRWKVFQPKGKKSFITANPPFRREFSPRSGPGAKAERESTAFSRSTLHLFPDRTIPFSSRPKAGKNKRTNETRHLEPGLQSLVRQVLLREYAPPAILVNERLDILASLGQAEELASLGRAEEYPDPAERPKKGLEKGTSEGGPVEGVEEGDPAGGSDGGSNKGPDKGDPAERSKRGEPKASLLSLVPEAMRRRLKAAVKEAIRTQRPMVFRGSGFRCRDLGFRFQVSDFRSSDQVSGAGDSDQVSGFRCQDTGSGFRDSDAEDNVQVSGAQGSVQVSGVRCQQKEGAKQKKQRKKGAVLRKGKKDAGKDGQKEGTDISSGKGRKDKGESGDEVLEVVVRPLIGAVGEENAALVIFKRE